MHAAITQALNHLFAGQSVPQSDTEAAFSAIMDGQCSEPEIAALLTALRVRGETVQEIAGAAAVMRARATRIPCQSTGLLDTCGTGGDQLHTFNISTATAFVAAGAGLPVAKHGNRSVSSSSGSADVLEALGVNLQLSPAQVGQSIDELGLGFCFAPLLHSAMRNVVPVRKALGFRTIFNLLGPLTNPAGAAFQLIGSSRIAFARMLAEALHRLGGVRALVVCGNDELDEVSLWGTTSYFEVTPAGVRAATWTASDFGLPECSVSQLRAETPAESAAIVRAILEGTAGAPRNMVVANTAAALVAAGRVATPREGVLLAEASIDHGRARAVLDRLVEFTRKLA